MIVPTKGVRADRALLAVAGAVLDDLGPPVTVNAAWERLRARRAASGQTSPVTFDWFALALSVLRALGLVDLRDGLLVRTPS